MEDNIIPIDRPDPNMAGRFYLHPVKKDDGSVSEELYIEIRAKGMTHSTKSIRINDNNKKIMLSRFPRAWAEFNESGVVPVDGTPIKMLPMVTLYLAEELKKIDVLTVEDLARLPDGALSDFRDGFRLRNAARGYLKSIEDYNNEPVYSYDNPSIEEPPQDVIAKKRGRPPKVSVE